MYSMYIASAILTLTSRLALAEPVMTAAAHLVPRATDPALVGYISSGGSYLGARTCDYPQTVSTSGNYVQCCPTTGSCPFYTRCSSNTLLAAGGVTVACDVLPSLICNTAIVLATPSAGDGGNYLACWQSTLGSLPFTFVRDIGSATAAGSTGAAASSNSIRSSGSSAATTTGSQASSAASASRSSSGSSASAASSNAAICLGDAGLVGGVVAMMAQMLL